MTYTRVPLGSCCEVVSGATPKTGVAAYWGGDVLWATPKDLSDLRGKYIGQTPRTLTNRGLQSCGASVLPSNSVLLSSRAPIGHVAINTKPMATNQGFKSLVPDTNLVDANYLYHWLRANRALLESLGNGATFKELSKAVVQKLEVPLPPIEEQGRIAKALDQVDALRAKRREAIALLDDLARSIFLDMFGDPWTNPTGWPTETLDHLVVEFRYGTSVKSAQTGCPTLRIPNVIGGAIDLTEIKNVPVSHDDFERLRLVEGDLLFVRTNGNPENVGRCALFTRSAVAGSGLPSNGFIYASYLIRARLKQDTINAVYAREYLLGGCGRAALMAKSKTSAGQFNINIQGIGSVRLMLPPIELQEEFATRMAGVEAMKEKLKSNLAELDALFASLQHRAFNGTLFPADSAA